jgi:hypothetical protein
MSSSLYTHPTAGTSQISERDRDRESVSPFVNDTPSVQSFTMVPSDVTYQSIDVLFDRTFDKSLWEPARPPQALGELLDSRFMIPLLFPSDPRLLAALPGKQIYLKRDKRSSSQSYSPNQSENFLNGIGTPHLSLSWRSRNGKIRDIGVEILRWMDGPNSAAKWGRSFPHEYEYEREDGHSKPTDPRNGNQNEAPDPGSETDVREFQAAPLTQRPSGPGRAKARYSISDINSIA